MRSTPRTCLFCGASRLTREHAWPRWLVAQLVGERAVRMQAKRGVGAAEESWPAADPGIVIRRFCKHCNNGWMSRLETAAKAIIDPLLSCSAQSLAPEDTYTVARWAVKTAMVVESAIPSQFWFFSESDRHRFRRMQAMPRGTQVWLARVTEHESLFGSGHTNRGPKLSPVPLEQSHTATMAFGPLVLQVHTVRAASSVSMMYNVRGAPGRRQWDNHSLQLWPLVAVPTQWPPSVSLKRIEEVAAFGRRFDPPTAGAA